MIYELLDEVIDNGYPQFTEASILGEYIKTDAHKLVKVKTCIRDYRCYFV